MGESYQLLAKQKLLGSSATEGNGPVREMYDDSRFVPEYLETRIARVNLPELTGKAKYILTPIVN